jgi:glycosyltransferase involved in cell wall biosynthesis
MPPMRALLLTPTFHPQLTGNAVTVGRIARGLTAGGVECRIIDLSKVPEVEVLKTAGDFGPDLVHNFHALRSGRAGSMIKECLNIPMITTLTGTDLHVNLKMPGQRELILGVLKQSDRLTVFNDGARRILLRERIPPGKISVIHQSVFFPARRERDFRAELNIGRRAPVFLLMGGIRRVKNFGYALPVLERVRQSIPDLTLLMAGPVLEEAEFYRLKSKCREKPWIRYLGEVPREEIPSLLACVDIVLNTSHSESEANAVLEALSCGKAVVGRCIPGNASLLTEETGFLFRNRKELEAQILHLLEHPREAGKRQREAADFIARHFSPGCEAAAYLQLYGESISDGVRGRCHTQTAS